MGRKEQLLAEAHLDTGGPEPGDEGQAAEALVCIFPTTAAHTSAMSRPHAGTQEKGH